MRETEPPDKGPALRFAFTLSHAFPGGRVAVEEDGAEGCLIEFGDGTQWSYFKLLQHYVDIAKTAGDDTIYGFETITWCPYERALIDTALLDAGEIAWIDAYHAKVRSHLAPLVEGEAKAWLEAACRAL